jgi:glutathione S-transferase
MNALTLHYHPLSSYCHKVLIAIDVLGIEVEKRLLDLGNPEVAAYFERLMDHPAVAATIDQARPYFKFYPGRSGLSRRFFDPASA